MLVVDNRWAGRHGIGRYASELLPRLSVPWSPIAPGGSPSSPTDSAFKRLKVGWHMPNAVYSPGYNGFLRAVPQTITLHDLIHLKSAGAARYRPYYDGVLRPLLRRNGHVITVSAAARDDIAEWLQDDSVEVINAGDGSSKEFAQEGPSYRHPRPYVMWVGNLKPHKNPDVVFSAIAQIGEVDLVAVASDVAGVRRLAMKHGVESRVQSVTGIDDAALAALYRGAVATLQPSLMEGFGLPALESLLCGTPVVYFSGCRSVAEICQNGGVAVADPNDATEWAAAIQTISWRVAETTSQSLASTYSWDLTASTVSQVLRERHGAALAS